MDSGDTVHHSIKPFPLSPFPAVLHGGGGGGGAGIVLRVTLGLP